MAEAQETPADFNSLHRHVTSVGQPIWVLASIDKSKGVTLNYDQDFMRDFINTPLTFLMKGEHLAVWKFLVETPRLQSREKMVDLSELGQDVMPASFMVHHGDPTQKTESSLADFRESAIGRVAPVYSGLWWIILLRAYTKWTRDNSLAESPDWQRAIHLILRLCLSKGCDTSPALLSASVCSMIAGRMVFIREIFSRELASDIKGEHLIVKNFLGETGCIQLWVKINDVGDSGFWWITVLHAYTKWTWGNYLAEGPDCQRPMHLIIMSCRLMQCDICPPFLCADGCSMQDPGTSSILFLNLHFNALSGVMPMSCKVHHPNTIQKTESSLAVFGETESSSQAESPIFQWAILSTIPALLCGNDCSMTEIVKLFFEGYHACPAWLCVDRHSTINQRMEMESVQAGRPSNKAVISLDELDKFIPSYLMGIGRLRWWCEVYGRRIDLSHFFKSKIVVFTTPPGGTFEFTIEYDGRRISASLYGRNLYVMGLRGPHGTLENKCPGVQRKNYMSGERVTVLPFKKNYRFLAPRSDVKNVRLGLYSLREQFEVLYKCHGESSEMKEALATIAVHLSEAGRIQSVLKDVCGISLDNSMETLGSRSNNSFWINDYGNYGSQEMERIDCLKSSETPLEIKNKGDIVVTEVEILNQIRIFPRDGYDSGIFEHEPVPKEATEDDYVLGAYDRWLRSSEGKKFAGKLKGSQFEDVAMEGDPGSSTTFPPYLLEDWCLTEEEQEEEQEEQVNKNDEPPCGTKEKEEQLQNDEGKSDKSIREVKEKGEVHMSSFGGTKISFEEFLDHFSAVKRRLMAFNSKGQNHLQVPLGSVERMQCASVNSTAFSASQVQFGMQETIFKHARMKMQLTSEIPSKELLDHFSSFKRRLMPLRSVDGMPCPAANITDQVQLGQKEPIFQYASMKTQLGTIGRHLFKPSHPIQHNLLLKASRVISRSIHLAI